MITSQEKLFTKTLKENPKGEVSRNAQLLVRAGYIDKVMAGVYSYLPLGLKVLEKIKNIVREEMDVLGAQEVYMPALTPKELWDTTERWDEIDVLFKLEGAGNKQYALGSTHEEVVTPLVGKFVNSYKDLPLAVYQIQDKFRNEPRAKSGLLRGREFSMKDLYSFHKDEKSLDDFYEKATKAYENIFKRCELDAKIVEASGGVFCKYSHEFQVITPYGEDIIFTCGKCGRSVNKEILESEKCKKCDEKLVEEKAIETGNIFKLGNKFSKAFGLQYVDESGKKQDVIMGCYGIGPSRIMGTIVEVFADEAGLVWPESVSPYDVHVLAIGDDEGVLKKAKEVAEKYSKEGKDVLLDDRNVSAGEKFADSDLLGISSRVVCSKKLLEKNSIEIKKRNSDKVEVVAE